MPKDIRLLPSYWLYLLAMCLIYWLCRLASHRTSFFFHFSTREIVRPSLIEFRCLPKFPMTRDLPTCLVTRAPRACFMSSYTLTRRSPLFPPWMSTPGIYPNQRPTLSPIRHYLFFVVSPGFEVSSSRLASRPITREISRGSEARPDLIPQRSHMAAYLVSSASHPGTRSDFPCSVLSTLCSGMKRDVSPIICLTMISLVSVEGQSMRPSALGLRESQACPTS